MSRRPVATYHPSLGCYLDDRLQTRWCALYPRAITSLASTSLTITRVADAHEYKP